MEEILKKYSSRKLWATIAGFVACLQNSDNPKIAIICGAVTSVYVAIQGIVDAFSKK